MRQGNRYSRSTPTSLSSRDMLMDLLCTEKSLSHLYDHGIMESSNDEVRYTFEELQHDEHENAHVLFKAMQQRGWYNTDAGADRSYSRADSNYLHAGRYGRSKASSEYAVTSGGSQRFGSKFARSGRRSTSNSLA
ncbi:spore coat protein|uniref:Coat F domain-containing protein n=1 Tax=Dendrosporobacter quercicolus TaxID=146817 RepID=A0A1G9LUF6_9FIRM|nr:spore coat protein [Dendrosporobacter quercicolus]NSL46834.1 spore coat protein [Dendrosporobacter quercicolus DSM 1736]SDL65650.1 Coat F domain-containing protein [Dendrosporobacter quercicolus]